MTQTPCHYIKSRLNNMPKYAVLCLMSEILSPISSDCRVLSITPHQLQPHLILLVELLPVEMLMEFQLICKRLLNGLKSKSKENNIELALTAQTTLLLDNHQEKQETHSHNLLIMLPTTHLQLITIPFQMVAT